uniref:CDC like kinase 4 n=1 Tax=Corvus moneduloides TaxID=1196302 RepID=A0A8U7MYF1_CORMO
MYLFEQRIPAPNIQQQKLWEMRHSKQSHCPEWDDRRSWDQRKHSSSRKRRRRSHSSGQESKHYKPSRISESHYLDDRAINERDHHDRRYVEEYRNDFCEVYDHRHYHRDYEKSHHHHYSKSSGRSRKSSHKRKHKRHHCSSHQSHSKSHRRKRSRSVEDDEEGHLICESGDVLRARCIEYFSTLLKNFSEKNLFRIVCQRRGAKEISLLFLFWFFLCFFVFLHIFFSVEFKYCVQKVPISK